MVKGQAQVGSLTSLRTFPGCRTEALHCRAPFTLLQGIWSCAVANPCKPALLSARGDDGKWQSVIRGSCTTRETLHARIVCTAAPNRSQRVAFLRAYPCLRFPSTAARPLPLLSEVCSHTHGPVPQNSHTQSYVPSCPGPADHLIPVALPERRPAVI